MRRKGVLFSYVLVLFSAMSVMAADLFESRLDFTREENLYEQAIMTAQEIIQSLPKIDNFSVMLVPKENSSFPKHLLRVSLGVKNPLIRDFELLSAGICNRDHVSVAGETVRIGEDLHGKIFGAIYEKCGLCPGEGADAFTEIVGYLSKKMGEMEKPHVSYNVELSGQDVKLVERSLSGRRDFVLLTFNKEKGLVKFVEDGPVIRKVFKEYKYEFSENKTVYTDLPANNKTEAVEFSQFRAKLFGYMKSAMSHHFHLEFKDASQLVNSALTAIVKEEAKVNEDKKSEEEALAIIAQEKEIIVEEKRAEVDVKEAEEVVAAQPANETTPNIVPEGIGLFEKLQLWWMK